MSTEILPFTSEAAWLQARTRDVTSTESAALFGLSPYVTAFELYHRKKSGTVPAFQLHERIKWGNALEEAIARGIAAEHGWEVAPMKDYWRVPAERVGSSFDFIITNHPSGAPAHLEVKNVDFLTFKRDWLKHDDGTLEAAAHIEMQVQHQMLVSGFPRSYIGALVGGNRGLVIERERDEPVIQAIRAKCAAFWADVDAGREPAAVFPADAAAVIALHGHAEPGKLLDASADAELAALLAAYKEAAAREKNADEDKQSLHAQILARIGDAERVLAAGFKVSATVIADTPATLITAEHVGKTYGGRRGYRRLTVTATK